MRLVLVPCGKKKQTEAVRAADLYISDQFKKMRRLAECVGDKWFILSAEHGLLSPEKIIEPYNKTLNKMPVDERRAWAARVERQMEKDAPNADEVVVLTGENYYQFLVPYLKQRYSRVRIPMKHMSQGVRLKWLGNPKNYNPNSWDCE